MTHAHTFTRRKPESTVETCTCGVFRFTEHSGPAIAGIPQTVKRTRKQIWVGIRVDTGRREVFRPDATPTAESHGDRFAACIGPFRTVRAAEFMASSACTGNPHVQNVADAERISRGLYEIARRENDGESIVGRPYAAPKGIRGEE